MEIATPRPAGEPLAFLGPALAGDPTRPLFTFYDDATGERTELSALTLGNWVAKTANLLVDGCGLGPGDRALVLLPPHWQTAAVLLGAWTAGVSVELPAAGPFDVVFVAADRLDEVAAEAAEASYRYVLGLAPMGAPLREVPDGYEDYAREVLAHGDRFQPSSPVSSYQDREAAAREAAATYGLRAGDRVLVDAAAYPDPDPAQWLLAPLAAGASVVLCANLDPGTVDDRARIERVSRVL